MPEPIQLTLAPQASPPLPMPVRLASPAGYRQSVQDPAHRQWHEGADFVAPTGTPVFAVRPGHVHAVFREDDRRTYGYGNLVVLYHPDDAVYSAYAHLSEIFVEGGAELGPGAVLGASGATSGGRFPRMGAHLHFATRRPRRSGAAPWPGGYPDPDRSPGTFREVFVDPIEYLGRFGMGFRGGELVIAPHSPADAGQGWPVRPSIATRSSIQPSIEASEAADASASSGWRGGRSRCS
ncbi:MAG: M23 family metallopeptidase [Sandaracinaceae bacterium]|nr:M23 family metallopeptidase [Sandaracinaceae bacterium]